MPKVHVAILAGGKSLEHEISLISASNIQKAIDTKKYQPFVVGITKTGEWRYYPSGTFAKNLNDANNTQLLPGKSVQLVKKQKKVCIVDAKTSEVLTNVDVAFSILHGNYGEDGAMQGFFEILGLPYVGCGVASSAITMDKVFTKQILDAKKIRNAKYLYFYKYEKKNISFEEVRAALGLPVFVKPARAGSSVGVSKVKSEKEFTKALDWAFECDEKVLIEESIEGREIECSILGSAPDFKVSPSGEIVLHAEFYSFDAKYVDADAAEVVVPTKNIDPRTEKKIQEMSLQIARALELKGLSRIDYRVKANGEVYLNEVNTLPGFTNISMYPKHFHAAGISYPKLIDLLIEDALNK